MDSHEHPPFPEIPGVQFRLVSRDVNYAVGSDGSLWTIWTPGYRKAGPLGKSWSVKQCRLSATGYPIARLGKYQTPALHTVVLEAFVGPCPAGCVCRHLDGNPGNSALDNLAWGTPKQNCEDTIRHRRTTRGELHPQAKFSDQQVLEIRALRNSGIPYREIAAKFGTTRNYVKNLMTGRKRPNPSWSHADGH